MDEGGEARDFLPYLIDTLPKPVKRSKSNIASPGFLPLPDKDKDARMECRNVLISFGGEDPAGLTSILTSFLISRKLFLPNQITVVKGPVFSPLSLPSGVTVLESPAVLSDIMTDYDLLFTSFGLTPYEAAASGLPVILFNPTKYHRKLSKIAGFPEIGVLKIQGQVLKRLLGNRNYLISVAAKAVSGDKLSLSDFIMSLNHIQDTGCPVCGKRLNRIIGRFTERSFFKCTKCGIIYQQAFLPGETGFNNYGKEYFFEEYKKQYGRTYLEDFLNIRTTSFRRIDQIRALLDNYGGEKLLDVGCAYGPFLSGADKSNFIPYGIDIAHDAVSYVMLNLGFNATCSSFEEFDLEAEFSIDKVNVITMWYVIEHFQDLRSILNKTAALL